MVGGGYESRRGEADSLGYRGLVRVHSRVDERERRRSIGSVHSAISSNTESEGGHQSVVSYDSYKMLLKENAELKARLNEIVEADARKRSDVKMGRCNIKKGSWTVTDEKNECCVTEYCKRHIYPYYKYLPSGWKVFSDDISTLCGKIKGKLVVPWGLKWEYYWHNTAVGIINKKFIDFRNNDRTSVHRQFRSE